ncbi:MAG: hypothetical protein AB7E80_01520 [Hyphomicrobiaceae bacterium]
MKKWLVAAALVLALLIPAAPSAYAATADSILANKKIERQSKSTPRVIAKPTVTCPASKCVRNRKFVCQALTRFGRKNCRCRPVYGRC